VNTITEVKGSINLAKPQKKSLRKTVKVAVLILILMGLVSHLIWRASGSNEWELAIDDDGVKVWTLKSPGTSLIKVKGETKVKSKLAGMIKLMEDPDSCVDAGCYDAVQLQGFESPPGSFAQFFLFRFALPAPFSPREFVIFQQRTQDPDTKVVEAHIIAAPSKTHPDPCCVRIAHMHNTWRVTPRANDMLDVEFTQDTDVGGLVPYFVTNMMLPQETFTILQDMQGILDKDKYKNAIADNVLEYAD
jgi:hypothetical protein